MTQTNLESIAHLDFDPKPIEPCDGVVIIYTRRGETKSNKCDREPVLQAFRACCGHLDVLCRPCFNELVDNASLHYCRFCKVFPKPVPAYVNIQML